MLDINGEDSVAVIEFDSNVPSALLKLHASSPRLSICFTVILRVILVESVKVIA